MAPCAASSAKSKSATAWSAAARPSRHPEFRDRERGDFAFMSNEVSSERRVEVSVSRIAAMIRQTKARGERVVFVAGPVVIHTGGAAYFIELIRRGYVDTLLSGNALAVHDAEQALFGTSLGVDLEAGVPVLGGHRHHMRAINAINRAGGIRGAVESGVLTGGVMFECVRAGVDVVLAGSIRDDGPLLDTITDISAAQDRYAEALASAGMVIVLSTMLHGIGVGNMLPAWVPGRVRGHQPRRRHQTRRPRVVADHRPRHGRRPVPAPARAAPGVT